MIFREELIQFIWSQQLFQNRDLTTVSGEAVKVLFPGVWNRQGSGPDFNQASVYIGNTLFAGSIEIHLKDKDWFQHEHDKDPLYNAVVLHVVLYGNDAASRQDGSQIPTLCLGDRISDKLLLKYHTLMNTRHSIPCESIIQKISSLIFNNHLDRMSVERLEYQTDSLKQELYTNKESWHDVLLSALIRSFGLPDNASPFREIAASLHSEILFRLCKEPFKIEALLFGCAGLLNAQPMDDYSSKLKKEYQFLKRKYFIKEINIPFKTGSVRPMALPDVKLAQLATLLTKGSSLTTELLSFADIGHVKAMLKVSPSAYWNDHYVLGKLSVPRSKTLSASNIEVIIINAIIPVLFLYARERQLADEQEKVIRYLEQCKAEQNKIIRNWAAINIYPKNARDSQALLHLYKTYCTFKRCLECSTGRTLLSRT